MHVLLIRGDRHAAVLLTTLRLSRCTVAGSGFEPLAFGLSISPTSYHCSTPRRFRSTRTLQNRTCHRRGALPRQIRCEDESAMWIERDPADSGRGLRGRAIENPEPSAISTTQLHGLPRFHMWPINLLV